MQPSDVSRWFTLVGIVASFISTFFAHGFLTLAKQAINEGRQVSRGFLVQALVRNTNINLAGIGITLIGLQASGKGTALFMSSVSLLPLSLALPLPPLPLPSPLPYGAVYYLPVMS